MPTSRLLGGALLAALSPTLAAQTITPLLLNGDPVPGTGETLGGISNVSVNDDGEWLVVAVVTGGSSFEAAILNGAAVLIEGDPLFDPPGLLVQGFDDVTVGVDGTLWWNVDTDASIANDEIFYRNLVRTAREGDAIQSGDVPPGTELVDIDGFRVDRFGDVLLLGEIDSALVGGPADSALLRQRFDDAGALVGTDVLVLETDPIPGSSDLVRDVGTSNSAYDVDLAGDHWIAFVRSDGASSRDEHVYVDGTPVAVEGASGPLLGTTWGPLNPTAVDILPSGDYIFRGSYNVIGGDGFDAIFLNGQPHIQQGDTSPWIAPNAFLEFGRNTPIFLADSGRIVFYGKTDNGDTSKDEGYFLNDRFLVQENVTPIGGAVVESLVSGIGGLDMSPNGRFVIFEAFLSGSRNGVFLIDLGLVEEMEACSTASASLAHTDGLTLLGEDVTFELDGAQDVGVLPVFLLSSAPVAGWPPCGLTTPFGELLVDVEAGNPQVTLLGPPDAGAPTAFTVRVPDDPRLLGRDFFAQGFYWDVGDRSPAENVRLSNGLRIVLALP